MDKGTRVKVVKHHVLFGYTGTIESRRGDAFIVKLDVIPDYCIDSYFTFLGGEIEIIEDIDVGAGVRVSKEGEFYGKLGTIVSVYSRSNIYGIKLNDTSGVHVFLDSELEVLRDVN